MAYVAQHGEQWVVVVDGREGQPYGMVRGSRIIFDSPDRLHYLGAKGADIYLVEERLRGKTAVRVLIAHTGESLSSQDVNAILKHCWDGEISDHAKITSRPFTHVPERGLAHNGSWEKSEFNEQFAIEWCAWQQML